MEQQKKNQRLIKRDTKGLVYTGQNIRVNGEHVTRDNREGVAQHKSMAIVNRLPVPPLVV